jgi:hypothetical protein
MTKKTANGSMAVANATHAVDEPRDGLADIAMEIATYKTRLPELLAREGEYVLIKGDQIIGFYKSFETAYRAGRRRFGLGPMLVKQITAVEPVVYIPNVVL